MDIAPYQISSCVRLIIAQRLVRKYCSLCHGKFSACHGCQNGYQGRTGIYEMLEITDALSDLIQQKPTQAQLKKFQCTQKIPTLWEEGLQKVKQEITSETEVRRVIEENA
jgi:general secretion pathway protein E